MNNTNEEMDETIKEMDKTNEAMDFVPLLVFLPQFLIIGAVWIW